MRPTASNGVAARSQRSGEAGPPVPTVATLAEGGLEYEENVLTDSTHITKQTASAQVKHGSSDQPASKQTAVGPDTSVVARAIVVEPLPAVLLS
jgi:hypothetical protein